MSAAAIGLHAGCILLGEAGILIRGPSGSGKSSLARHLIGERRARGGFAALVADDRVLVTRHGGRLVARPHPAIAGLSEYRGLGIRSVPHEPAAVLRLVVDLLASGAIRSPEQKDLEAVVLNVTLPRIGGSIGEIGPLMEAAIAWP